MAFGLLKMQKSFFPLIIIRLCGSFCHRWCNHLDFSDKFSVHNNYKNCFEREVGILWMEIYRNSLAQFRLGVSQVHNYDKHRFLPTAAGPFCANKQKKQKCILYSSVKCATSWKVNTCQALLIYGTSANIWQISWTVILGKQLWVLWNSYWVH